MFVSVIFDVEYFGRDERHKWFLKNVSHAKENDFFIITHETLVKNYRKYVENCSERFFDEFEMERLTDDEFGQISMAYIEDSIFDEMEERCGSRTRMLYHLLNERDEEIEEVLCNIIDKEMEKRQDFVIEGIFTCLDAFESIKEVAKKYEAPVVEYVFSALRKVHGYADTMYIAEVEGNLRASYEVERRYDLFQKNNDVKFWLSKRELLAMFGKRKNIPFLKLIDQEGVHELGICRMAWGLTPRYMKDIKYTDIDLYYEAKKKLDTSDIVVREHPNIPWSNTGNEVVKEHTRNDPVSFILSCKRIGCVDSQIGLKALLWNRSVYSKCDVSVLGWMCEENIESLGKADDRKLNYFIISYLVPSKYMFDKEYWRWRLQSNPSEFDIYMKHLAYYVKRYQLDLEKLETLEEKKRFKYILRCRNVDSKTIELLCEENGDKELDYDVLYSKIKYNVNQETMCINCKDRDMIKSSFVFEKTSELIEFYPFVDVGGFFQVFECCVDGNKILGEEEFRYIKKNVGKYEISLKGLENGEHTLEIYWRYYFS